MSDPARITHMIEQSVVGAPSQPRTGPVFNPATGQQTGTVDFADADLVGRVVERAHQAWLDSWADTSLTRRSTVLFGFRELLHRNRERIAALITAEHGKVPEDAIGEVNRGLEVAEFACGIPHLLKGAHSQEASAGVDVFSVRQPLGVSAVISPFNFPVMVPLWFLPMALGCGNAVILKPSEKDPSATLAMAQLWSEAGLPDGVLSVLLGDQETAQALIAHPRVASVSFVGSTPVARQVYETATARGARVQSLGGAKNHLLVLPDADLDLAADAAVNAGFGSAGQRCMAISALVVLEQIADDLLDRISARLKVLRTGDGRRGCDMGPVITREAVERISSYVQAGADAGATVVLDGREARFDADAGGFFIGPTLLDRVEPQMSVYTDEVFGPLLTVLRVASWEEALELINANPYGNGAAVFTQDGAAARRFQREVQVGMVGINVPIPVPVAAYSFGGWKDSLFGDTHAYGTEGVHFFTRGKVVTQRWPHARHGGLDLGFPQNQ